jgi:beta-galactosidase
MSLRTAGEPVMLRLYPDRAQLRSGMQDLSYVTVELVDAQGVLCQQADRPVYFTVQGEGSIAAVGSANPMSTEAYTGNMRSTHLGRCLVVLKAGDQVGELRLRAQADGVNASEVLLRVGG